MAVVVDGKECLLNHDLLFSYSKYVSTSYQFQWPSRDKQTLVGFRFMLQIELDMILPGDILLLRVKQQNALTDLLVFIDESRGILTIICYLLREG